MNDFPADVHFVTESDAPPVIVLAGSDDSERSSPPHSYRRGQLFGSTSGLLTVGLETGVWVVPATHAVWVPPYRLHWARSHGLFSGYAVYVAHDSCADLPAQPCSLRVSGLLREAVLRASAWPPGELDTRGERIAAVILDEIRTCPVDALGLPSGRRRPCIASACAGSARWRAAPTPRSAYRPGRRFLFRRRRAQPAMPRPSRKVDSMPGSGTSLTGARSTKDRLSA